MPTKAEVVSALGEWLDFFSVHEKDGDLWITSRPSEWVPDEVFNPLLKKAMELGGGYDSHHRAVRIPVEAPVAAKPSEPRDPVFQTADRLDKSPETGPKAIAPKKTPGFIPASEIPRTPSGRVDIQAYAGLKQPEKQSEKPKPDNGYRFIGLDMLVSSPFQPRLEVDEPFLEELVASIREKGVLVPILVRRLASGNYEVVDGNTTLRAAKVLELKAVPVIIQELDDQAAMEVAYQRNNTRRDWSDYERARFLNEYGRRFGQSQEQIAMKTGVSRQRIGQLFAMVQAEDHIPKAVLEKLNERQFRAIEALPEDKKTAVLEEIKQTNSIPSLSELLPTGNATAVAPPATEISKGEGEPEQVTSPATEPSAGAPTPRQTSADELRQVMAGEEAELNKVTDGAFYSGFAARGLETYGITEVVNLAKAYRAAIPKLLECLEHHLEFYKLPGMLTDTELYPKLEKMREHLKQLSDRLEGSEPPKSWWSSLEKIIPKPILDDVDHYVVIGGDHDKREFVPFYLNALYDAFLKTGGSTRLVLEEADQRQSDARDEEAAPQ